MTTKRIHGTGTDFKEGELLFQVLEGTTVVYNIAGLKSPDGKIIPIVDDTRLSPRIWVYKGADYLSNLIEIERFPTDFIQQCVATGTNAVINPAGTGQVLIAKANITATMGDSTITAITPLTAFGGGSVIPPVVLPPNETEAQKTARLAKEAADEKARLAALEDDKKTGLSNGVIAGIVTAVVVVAVSIWAFVTKPWKD